MPLKVESGIWAARFYQQVFRPRKLQRRLGHARGEPLAFSTLRHFSVVDQELTGKTAVVENAALLANPNLKIFFGSVMHDFERIQLWVIGHDFCEKSSSVNFLARGEITLFSGWAAFAKTDAPIPRVPSPRMGLAGSRQNTASGKRHRFRSE